MHKKLAASRAELAKEKAERNRGGGREWGPSHTPNNFGLAKLRLLGELTGIKASDEDDNLMGNITYRKIRGGSTDTRKGLAFTLRAQI